MSNENKLEKQLEAAIMALEYLTNHGNLHSTKYAEEALSQLLSPPVHEIKVKAWKCIKCNTYYEVPIESCETLIGNKTKCNNTVFAELVGSYEEEIPERVIYKKVFGSFSGNTGIIHVPKELIGEIVRIQAKE